MSDDDVTMNNGSYDDSLPPPPTPLERSSGGANTFVQPGTATFPNGYTPRLSINGKFANKAADMRRKSNYNGARPPPLIIATDTPRAEAGCPQSVRTTRNPSFDVDAKSPLGALAHSEFNASQFMQKMTGNEKDLIISIMKDHFNILNVNTRNAIADIFKKLDTTGDGTLSKEDFQHPIACVQNNLTKMWEFIRDYFDFNADGKVDPREFMQCFTVQAMLNQNPEPVKKGTLFSQIMVLGPLFNKVISDNCDELINTLEGHHLGSPGRKESNKSMAQKMLETLSDQDINCVFAVIDNDMKLFQPEEKERVRHLFDILDKGSIQDGMRIPDGFLTENAFTHNIPFLNDRLQNIWNFMQQNLDFDNDKVVSFDEFNAFFVVFALLMKSSFDIPPGPLGYQLNIWSAQMRDAITAHVDATERDIKSGFA